jgi:hypothetical protein
VAPVDDDDSELFERSRWDREVAAALREAAEERTETASLMRREAEAARAMAQELCAQAEALREPDSEQREEGAADADERDQ